jgi:hypothetical protein
MRVDISDGIVLEEALDVPAQLATLDHIGVDIRYAYTWATPLKNLVGLNGGGYTIDKSNSMRMEPVL